MATSHSPLLEWGRISRDMVEASVWSMCLVSVVFDLMPAISLWDEGGKPNVARQTATFAHGRNWRTTVGNTNL